MMWFWRDLDGGFVCDDYELWVMCWIFGVIEFVYRSIEVWLC